MLSDLQRLLESLYHVDVDADVAAFTIGSAELEALGSHGAPGNGAAITSREELL